MLRRYEPTGPLLVYSFKSKGADDGNSLSYPPSVLIRAIGRIREGIFREGSGFPMGIGRSAEARDLAGRKALSYRKGRDGWKD